jgi:hypothetical protein
MRCADATEISPNYRNVDRTGWRRASWPILPESHGHARLSSVVSEYRRQAVCKVYFKPQSSGNYRLQVPPYSQEQPFASILHRTQEG